jgi:carbon-monoxide dehydrogenase large subunit
MGVRVPRVEDARLLRGQGRFVGDIVLPGMLHANFLRSPLAHARLKRIDTSKAKRVPGVHAVLAWADLRPLLTRDRIPLSIPSGAVKFDVDPVMLAHDELC